MKAAQASSTSLTVPSPVKQGLVSSACAWLARAAKTSAPARAARAKLWGGAPKRMKTSLGNSEPVLWGLGLEGASGPRQLNFRPYLPSPKGPASLYKSARAGVSLTRQRRQAERRHVDPGYSDADARAGGAHLRAPVLDGCPPRARPPPRPGRCAPGEAARAQLAAAGAPDRQCLSQSAR